MTNVQFEEWARPQVRDLLCFAEGSEQRGSRIADLFALVDADTASRVTVWACDILSLMQSAFEEGWSQGADDLRDYQQGTGRYEPRRSDGGVTPELFNSWNREQRRQFLEDATAAEGLAAGVASVCGSCGDPLAPGAEGHQCDPSHVAEAIERLHAAPRKTAPPLIVRLFE